jgi:hypothetical protein
LLDVDLVDPFDGLAVPPKMYTSSYSSSDADADAGVGLGVSGNGRGGVGRGRSDLIGEDGREKGRGGVAGGTKGGTALELGEVLGGGAV